MYEEMRLRPDGEIVRVYGIDPCTGNARIWSGAQFLKSDNGWMTIKSSKLVPMDYDLHNSTTVSRTKQQKAKKRLHLEDATWRSTDGKLWSHSELGEAIEHELKIMNKELEENASETVSV